MKGIQYVSDERRKKTAVLIDLKELGGIWEDIQDILVSELRKREKTASWETLKAEKGSS